MAPEPYRIGVTDLPQPRAAAPELPEAFRFEEGCDDEAPLYILYCNRDMSAKLVDGAEESVVEGRIPRR